ncbi:RNA polymerase sigma-70 factor [Carboxylicivirga mesophila]|uniref:RNA polymerase sigma-70 factor n=1 Tax=Carboxylicivirga mesophila TaxID=1166478 RepID=A0ABS5KA16_9BACT|nr:RNA polymerase sigma-70 factor [Carboxylicivirga mesophila]MBS2211366.1 RNA polymerase sigma-70 factor [Carboxylicivirga mesophila]
MQETKQIQTKKEFEHFFNTHHADMVRYAYKFVQRTDVASDIVQEAFVKLWEGRRHILANISLKAYLYKVVYNLSLNHIEQLKLRARHHDSIYTDLMEMEMDYYKDEKSLLQDERLESLRSMLNELPKGCYEVIDLSRFQGLKNKEIAQKLDVPVRTIETRIYRCISKLKELVKRAV